MCQFVKRALFTLCLSILLIWTYQYFNPEHSIINHEHYGVGYKHNAPMPSRSELISRLENANSNTTTEDDVFDVLIIGGGATGSAIALDANSRGLKVALFEKEDFGSGTSSRSTKLLHGGVRYLKKAMTNFDASQFFLVREALHERYLLFNQAPHLTNFIPLITPMYSWSEIIPTFIQLKLYDWIAYPHLHNSYFVTAEEAVKLFPMIKKENLKGAMVYYDGQFDDARTNLGLVMTSIQRGVLALNRFSVIELTHNDSAVGVASSSAEGQNSRKVNGAIVRDELTQKTYTVKANTIINAAGHFADDIRLMDDAKSTKMLQAASGTHIVLDGRFCPVNEGLQIPKTKDNRVLFLLPWQGKTLAGTTDSPCSITNHPKPSESDIQYILDHINMYFSVKVSREDVLSAWSGIRPLKKATEEKDTASISREHAIYTSPSGLMSIIGGKWTTTRSMAADIMEKAIKQSSHLKERIICPPFTDRIKLVGGEEFNPLYAKRMKLIDPTISAHLNSVYGDQAYLIEEIALKELKSESRLHPLYPFIEAEIVYSIRYEYAVKILDILERRTRIQFIDAKVSHSLVPIISNILARELKWTNEQKLEEETEVYDYLQ